MNDADLDWPNIAEETESVGRSELAAVKSLLRQALVHELKARAWPQSLAAPGRRAEARLFQAQARDHFAPSMWQRIDVRELYADALKALPTRSTVSRRCRWRKPARSRLMNCWRRSRTTGNRH